MGSDLNDIRSRLDAIDSRWIELLAERRRIEGEVAALKAQGKLPIRDIERERQQLAALERAADAADLDGHFVARLFRQVLEQSVRTQQEILSGSKRGDGTGSQLGNPPHTVVVSYQGTDGSYSKMAAEKHFGPSGAKLVTRGYDTFTEILEAVRRGDADYAMLPIENTTAGSINDAYDLLGTTDLTAVGEEILRVKHCLAALPGAKLQDIRRIYSHPQGLAQCAEFVRGLSDCHAEAFIDTAMSVVKVRDEGERSQAAIASQQAAELYGLEILAHDIANQKHNYTRFMVLSRQAIAYDLRIPCKTSLIFATAHKEGALLRCLGVLAQRGLNLTKLESRPRAGSPWEYIFYVDFEGNRQDPKVEAALSELMGHTKFLKVLGSYPARTTRAGAPAQPLPPRRPSNVSSDGENGQPHAAQVTVTIGAHTLDGQRPLLIAGPALIGGREHIVACAREARRAGVDVLRGGYRRVPDAAGGFAGIGVDGLPELHEVGHGVGLEVATTVVDAHEVAPVARHVHLIEVAPQSLGDNALLEQLGRIDRPVLLWCGPDGDREAWLRAAALIRRGGNQQVLLGVAQRGGRVDLGAIAQGRSTGLPVVADVGSLGATPVGEGPRLALAIADAALALGAVGLSADFDVDGREALRALTANLAR